MSQAPIDPIKRHVAGATMAHTSPFENLDTPQNTETLSKEFIHRFVKPFYMRFGPLAHQDEVFVNDLKTLWSDINHDVITKLLGDFNWRTRSMGALFAALKHDLVSQDQIGHLLLKSEVCYAGRYYCIYMAAINNADALKYLHQYLTYYLSRKDLYYDQGAAMGALAWIDEKNSSREMETHVPAWETFTADKQNWSLKRSLQSLEEIMAGIEGLKRVLK